MSTQIYVNLPVADLDRAVGFYEALGFRQDERMRDDSCAAVVVDETIVVMLLVRPFFGGFTAKPVGDAREQTSVILALSAESPEAVDALADRAETAGATPGTYGAEMPGMHGRAFADLDGHQWEVLHTVPDFWEG